MAHKSNSILVVLRDGLSLIPLYTKTNKHYARSARGSHRRYWKDAVINAAVLAGFNFFATLAGMAVSQIIQEPVKALIAAGVAAGLGFFSRLMVERGITVEEQ